MSVTDSLQSIASTLGNANATGDTFHMSRATFQTIIDQLRRLNKNGDDHDQVINELKHEIYFLKPQVQGLQAENAALKQEIGVLRGQQRDGPLNALSASVPLPRVDTRSRSGSPRHATVSESASQQVSGLTTRNDVTDEQYNVEEVTSTGVLL